jgi:hypothetical protein
VQHFDNSAHIDNSGRNGRRGRVIGPFEDAASCVLEDDVFAAVAEGRWPEGVDSTLREHVSRCAVCSDVAGVAVPLQSEKQALRTTAVLPEAGQVWWKAQLRARREAAEAAGRPITVAQMVAFGCAMGLLGACVGATSEWFQTAFRWTHTTLNAMGADKVLPSVTAMLNGHLMVAFTVGGVFLVVPAVLYFAVGRD